MLILSNSGQSLAIITGSAVDSIDVTVSGFNCTYAGKVGVSYNYKIKTATTTTLVQYPGAGWFELESVAIEDSHASSGSTVQLALIDTAVGTVHCSASITLTAGQIAHLDSSCGILSIGGATSSSTTVRSFSAAPTVNANYVGECVVDTTHGVTYEAVAVGTGASDWVRTLYPGTGVLLATTGAPSAGTGENGNYAFDSTTGILYLKSTGTWSSTATLALGTGTFALTTGAPSGSTGLVGAFAFDTASGILYKKTGASTWTAEATLALATGRLYTTTGCPTTEGTNGDFAVDPSTGTLYYKTGGAWGTACTFTLAT